VTIRLGYALSSEEHTPNDLVKHTQHAEKLGFEFAMISDHFHPWVNAQGHSPFVWSVIGGIAQATETIRLGTGVTCPTMRIHPAIMAQASATVAAMMPDRFFFGVGTGENLNEHITGMRWPPFDIRAEMLEEAVKLIRLLWQGETTSYWGKYYTVEDARIYTLPEVPPPILLAAGGPKAAEMAGQIGDGLINTSPDQEVIGSFQAAGGGDKPRLGKVTFCWAKDKQAALATVMEYWPTGGLGGELNQELRTVAHFEQATKKVKPEDLEEAFVLGPDPQPYLEKVQEFLDAGFDHLYFHQIGPDQAGFFNFWEQELHAQIEKMIPQEMRGKEVAPG
jgi:coenzyme F420-dependent glucose-6-phosphate dehydrogenase